MFFSRQWKWGSGSCDPGRWNPRDCVSRRERFSHEAGDQDSVENLVLSLIENPELRIKMGSYGRRMILERHSPTSLLKN